MRPRSPAAARRAPSAPAAPAAFVAALALVAAAVAGCVAGPDYVRPTLPMPAAWKVEAPWRAAAPDDGAAKGPWWQRFGDPRLDALQRQALAQSPTLALACGPPRAGAGAAARHLGRAAAERDARRAAPAGSASRRTGR